MSIIDYYRYMKNGKNLLFKYYHSRRALPEHSVFTSTGISLRATPPNAFNDPFEFASNLLTNNESRMIESLTETGDFDAGTVAVLGETMLAYEDIATRWQRLREEISKNLGVVCLSACWDDTLMWSHYSDEHRGFAVAIDRDHHYIQQLHFQPVEYESQRPSYFVEHDPEREGFRIPGNHITTSIYTKSEHWNYEHEWRCIHQLDKKNSVTLIDIPAEAIPLILLGWRHSGETARLISDAITAWPVTPRMAVVMPHWTDYRLDVGKWLPEDGTESRSDIDRIVSLGAGLDKGRSTYLSQEYKIQKAARRNASAPELEETRTNEEKL